MGCRLVPWLLALLMPDGFGWRIAFREAESASIHKRNNVVGMTSDTSGSLSCLRTQLRRHAGEVVPVGTESPTHLDVADDDDGHTGDDDPEDNDDDVDGDEDNVDNELPSGKNPHRS